MKDLENIYKLIDKGMSLEVLNKYLLDNRGKYNTDELLLIINYFTIHN